VSVGETSIGEGAIAEADGGGGGGPAPLPSVFALINQAHARRRRCLVLDADAAVLDERQRPRKQPRLLPWATSTQTSVSGFRVADDNLVGWGLWVGVNKEPDLTANPTAFSSSSPVTHSPTLPATGQLAELNCVARKRNKYGLWGFNVLSRKVTVNHLGAEDLGPVTAPYDVAVYDYSAGYIRVLATYSGAADRNPADRWECYVSTTAADPTPGVSATASASTMSFGFGQAGLAVTVGPYTAGSAVRVVVTAKRNSDSRRASATAVPFTLASALSLEHGDLLGGASFT